ncbi:MAG: ABC transporter ATP-binding protein [Planctomycetota bacterium]|jgi:iron complex transport system ATP-binding protein
MTLAVEQISHAYRRVQALTEISVQASPGCITAVIGPNAAGKSTLLRCVIGGIRPTEGHVLIDGEPAHRLRTGRLARRVAYVPQRSVVSAAFTVREVVELGRYALPPSRRRIDDALEQLDLVQIADRPYPALSVGQQQRAALARAVAQLAGDGYLVLDEPTSAMDLRHVREGMLLLRRLADGGATVLVAIHDLMLAASAADECWLLDGGRLAASGPTREVMNLDRLRAVFGVGFEWLDRPGRDPILLPETER